MVVPAADEGDGLVACHLQTLHQGQGHEVAGSQAVGGAVKADVEGGLAVVDEVDDLVIGDLSHEAAGLSSSYRVINISSCLSGRGKIKHPLPK